MTKALNSVAVELQRCLILRAASFALDAQRAP